MNLIQKIKKIKSLKDIYYYLQGKYRYYFYYGGNLSSKYEFISKLRKRVIRKHIKSQIEYRISTMNPACYNGGACVICGCETTALQMANKSCDGLEYPPIMFKSQWNKYKTGKTMYIKGEYSWLYVPELKQTKLFKETRNSYVQIKTPIQTNKSII